MTRVLCFILQLEDVRFLQLGDAPSAIPLVKCRYGGGEIDLKVSTGWRLSDHEGYRSLVMGNALLFDRKLASRLSVCYK